jgi:hypothetical protein
MYWFVTQETTEMNRQMKLTRSFTNSHFEEEVMFKTELKTLSKLKGDLSIKSAYLFFKCNK